MNVSIKKIYKTYRKVEIRIGSICMRQEAFANKSKIIYCTHSFAHTTHVRLSVMWNISWIHKTWQQCKWNMLCNSSVTYFEWYYMDVVRYWFGFVKYHIISIQLFNLSRVSNWRLLLTSLNLTSCIPFRLSMFTYDR